MDVKIGQTNTAATKLSKPVQPIRSDRSEIAHIGKQSSNTDVSRPAPEADTSATSALEQMGRAEAQQLHQDMIARLREEIRNGTYEPQLDVVAERVAEVLGAV